MSLAALTQVYDEVRRLAIGGSTLASGDFRLKKLVDPLRASAAKAPVFGKVADAIETLTASPPEKSAGALLELSTLVSAVLYTQGETGAEGKLEPVPTTEMTLPTANTSARVLKPLLEALTTTGSGREELIKDAHQRGAFADLRLVRVAVQAIDDPYPPIAEFIADAVLPLYGQAIYDDLLVGYNPKAKGGHVRRLRVMHRLDPARTHELVEQALESGSADMKVVAIECLEGREDSLSFLLEQARAKAQDVRRAAYNAMATLTDDIVVDTLTKALSSADVELSAEAAGRNRSPKLLTFLLEDARKRLQTLPGIKDKADAGKAAKHVYALLGAFATRDDKQSVAFLSECFEQRNDIGALKAEFDVDHINRRVASLLFRTGAKPALKLLIDAHETLPPEVVDWAIAAAVQTRKPREVYDLFSPLYLAKPGGKRKGSDDGTRRREVVRAILETLSQRQRHYWYGSGAADDTVRMEDFIESAELDPRWLDAAIETDDLHIVRALARPKHKATTEYLSRSIDSLLAKKGDLDHQVDDILETMIRVEHPQAVERFLAALQKAASSKHHYFGYWLVRLVPSLPKTAVPQLEALLPTFPEKFADQLVPYLAELQAQS